MATASLPMYDLPELRAATDAWWQGLARALSRAGIAEVPASLTRGPPEEQLWRDPGLLLSQSCGYPLTHGVKHLVVPVATPVYEAPGCVGARYSSAFVVRAGDPAASLAELAGRRCAVNGPQSQSGYNVLRHAVAPLSRDGRFFAEVAVTGGHGASVAALAGSRADVAAIDCVTYRLFELYQPAAVAALRVLAWSETVPGLPYVTRAEAGPDILERLRDGLMAALADPDLATAREALLLTGAEVLEPEAYGRIVEMEQEATQFGFPEIA